MKQMTLYIGSALKFFIGIVFIAGCAGGGGGGSPAPGDTKPPQALSLKGEEAGGRVVSFMVDFDEPVDPATVNDAHFKLTAESGEAVLIQLGCADSCRQVILTPQTEIQPNVLYRLQVSLVTDMAGNPLPEPAVFTFKKEQSPPQLPPPEPTPIEPPAPTPGDTTPPRIDSVFPSDGDNTVEGGTSIRIAVKLNEPVQPSSVNAESFRLLISGSSTPISGSYDCPAPCTEATFTPAGALLAGTPYQIRVTTGITDLAGNPVANPYSGSFTTLSAPIVVEPPVTPPATPTSWTKQMGNRFNQTLNGADAVSATKAWAVGLNGVIIQTTDGGTNWTLQESGTFLPLYGVDFLNEQTGVAAGGAPTGATAYTNLVLKTTDGGAHWTVQTLTGLPGALKAVQWADAQHAWAVGGKGIILATSDGGARWETQSSGIFPDLDTVDFLDASRGWASGVGKSLLKTTDGGRTWVKQFTFSTPIRAVDFVDTANGWAVGDAGTLLATTDGGASWQPIPLPATVSAHTLYGLRMNGSSGWAVGDRGTVLYYDGSAWSLQPNVTSRLLRGVAAEGQSKSWGVGDYGVVTFATAGTKGQILNATDTAELHGPFFINSQTGWVVGSSARIYQTDDGGASWKLKFSDWKKEGSITWTHIETPVRLCAKDEAGNWIEDPIARDALGQPIPGAKYKCIRTTTVNLYGSFFLPAQGGEPAKGWLVGQPSFILYTPDGGATWIEQNFDPFATDCYDCKTSGIYLRRVQFTDPQNGWVVGRFRTIYKTTNGGETWKELNNNWKYPTADGTCTTRSGTVLTRMGGHLFGLSVNPSNPNDVWVGGGCCGECNPLAILAHTLDGGATWKIQTDQDAVSPLPTNSRFRQIQMMGNVGWAIGSGGVFVRTEDGGLTWKPGSLGFTVAMALDLFFTNPATGWIVGEKGQMLKTEDGGVTWKQVPTGTRNGLFGVRFLDPRKGWAIGAGELILKSETGGN